MKLTQPFRNGLLSNYDNRKTFEVIPLTYPLETFDAVDCLLAIISAGETKQKNNNICARINVIISAKKIILYFYKI
jgi:hypothetical protein